MSSNQNEELIRVLSGMAENMGPRVMGNESEHVSRFVQGYYAAMDTIARELGVEFSESE